MKSFNAKLFLLSPASIPRPSPPSPHRLYLLAFLSFFTFASLLTLLSTTTHLHPPPTPTPTHPPTLPSHVFNTLLHLAASSNSTGRMPTPDLHLVASILRRRSPANLLVFGLSPETPLWRALNAGGRTVFLDENEYYISHLEARHPGLEGYDVAYTTKVSQLSDLIADTKSKSSNECRPIQNLLYSDCKLAINDLPNSLYEVSWDVILVDGPRGYDGNSPGRMAAIFTAAVMARTKNAVPTEVLVHDYTREVERVSSEEFLCNENMILETSNEQLKHFVIRGGDGDRFCTAPVSDGGAKVQ